MVIAEVLVRGDWLARHDDVETAPVIDTVAQDQEKSNASEVASGSLVAEALSTVPAVKLITLREPPAITQTSGVRWTFRTTSAKAEAPRIVPVKRRV